MQFFANNFLNNGPIRTKPTSINSYRCTEQEYDIKFQKKIKKKKGNTNLKLVSPNRIGKKYKSSTLTIEPTTSVDRPLSIVIRYFHPIYTLTPSQSPTKYLIM